MIGSPMRRAFGRRLVGSVSSAPEFGHFGVVAVKDGRRGIFIIDIGLGRLEAQMLEDQPGERSFSSKENVAGTEE
jgi:hypothetical protein